MKTMIAGILRKIYPPFLSMLMIAIMVGLHFYIPILELYDTNWRLCGILPLLAGLLLSLSARRQLNTRKTTPNTFERPQELVTDGCFRNTRNPIYLGLALVTCGALLLCGTLSPAVAFVVFILAADRFYIPYEEDMMQHRFGQAYEEYKERMRRWF